MVAKLCDFGMACHPVDLIDGLEGLDCLGTPAYAAPEMARVNEMIPNSMVDIWSVGMICAEMLTGIAPRASYGREWAFVDEFWHDKEEVVVNFVNALLQFNHTKRLNTSDALRHAWFSEL